MSTLGRPPSAHALIDATPGKPGGNRTGDIGKYLCSCGQEYPGIESFKAHRATSLRATAIERAARALMEFEVASYNWHYPNLQGFGWDDIPENIQNKYRDRVSVVLDAAKVRQFS